MKFLFFLALFFLSLTAHGRDSEFQTLLRYDYQLSSLVLPNGAKANYSGASYGLHAGQKFSNNGYGLGFMLGYDTRNLDNSANSASTSETLKGSTISIVTRLYALNLYLGAGILYSNLKTSYSVGGAATNLQYTAFGLRLETGGDVPLGKNFFLAPKVHYDLMRASTPSTTGTNKLNTFGVGAGIGISF